MAVHVCVAGLGVNGAACARALARRGARVTALDPRAVPHTEGSSHGITRVIRFAYFEHPLYVPLALEAIDVWTTLADETGTELFRRTGALSLGTPGGPLLEGVRASVRDHGLPHETFDARAVERRFPDLRVGPGEVGIYEQDAGVLAAEDCVQALLDDAAAAGATLDTGTRAVRAWHEKGGGVTVETDHGPLDADALILAVGPWLPGLLGPRGPQLAVERQVIFWFDAGRVDAARLPVILRELPDRRLIYVAPGPGPRFKAGLHHDGTTCDPDGVDRTARGADAARVRPLVRALLPATGATAEGQVCLYTNSADGHFVIDRLPGHERVFLVSACSGHGFKFAPATGAAVADLVLGTAQDRDLSPFRVDRRVDAPA